MKKLKSLAAFVLSMALLTGCSSGSTTTLSSTSGTTASTTSEDGVNITLVLSEELNSLDPNINYSATSMGAITYVNEGLCKYGADGTIVNGMAETIDISEDGCTYTFTIRDDAYWSNGTKVTAHDFEFSMKRLADPTMGCVYSYMLTTVGIKNASEVTLGEMELDELGVYAVDDKTLIIELDAPRSYFSQTLAQGSYFMPINEEFYNETGDKFMKDMDNSIYCGPMIVSDWDVGGTTYTLSKNPDYYDVDTVTCDSISYILMTDDQQAILSWESDTVDQLSLGGDFVSLYEGDEAIQYVKSNGMFFISFNTENEYLANKNLRLAISTAIEKSTIVNNILLDGSTPADYIIPADFAYDSTGTVTYRENAGYPTYNEYDLEAAAAYWEAAKAELGTDTISLDFLYNEDTQLASTAAYIQSELQKALPGLTVNLQVTTYNQRLTNMGNGDYDMGITRWYADYADASTYLDMWIEESGLNYGNWYNEEYNELYKKVIGEYAIDEEARIETQAEMEKIFLEDAAVCPLYQTSFVYLRNPAYNWVASVTNYTLYQYTDFK